MAAPALLDTLDESGRLKLQEVRPEFSSVRGLSAGREARRVPPHVSQARFAECPLMGLNGEVVADDVQGSGVQEDLDRLVLPACSGR